jgi:hypothetical protein
MQDFLILAALIGIGFGLGYGVRELISRQRRHRHRRWDWPDDGTLRPDTKPANPKPNTGLVDLKPDNLPAEPAGGFAIHLDRLLIAANDDRTGRDRRRREGGQRVSQNKPRDEFDGTVRDLLGELNRRSVREGASARRADVGRRG